MSTKFPIQKFHFILFALIFILSSCSTWHYKSPRVSVDIDRVSSRQPGKGHSSDLTVTSRSNYNDDDKVVLEKDDVNMLANASNQGSSNINDHKPTKSFFKPSTKTKKEGLSFSDKLKKDHKLLQVKDVEKTALSGWLKIMIILFAVGLLLVIVGAILSAVFFGGFWWLFYMIGSLCILAGCVVLVLGLLGIM